MQPNNYSKVEYLFYSNDVSWLLSDIISICLLQCSSCERIYLAHHPLWQQLAESTSKQSLYDAFYMIIYVLPVLAGICLPKQAVRIRLEKKNILAVECMYLPDRVNQSKPYNTCYCHKPPIFSLMPGLQLKTKAGTKQSATFSF